MFRAESLQNNTLKTGANDPDILPNHPVEEAYETMNLAVQHTAATSTKCCQKKDICKLLEACEARICRVMEVCGLGGEVNSSHGESNARAAEESAARRHSFWHSGLNTAVRPGSEPATEGNGEKIARAWWRLVYSSKANKSGKAPFLAQRCYLNVSPTSLDKSDYPHAFFAVRHGPPRLSWLFRRNPVGSPTIIHGTHQGPQG